MRRSYRCRRDGASCDRQHASCEAPDGATVSFRPEAIIKRPPHEGAEYAVAFKAKTVLRVRPFPCLPPYAGYLHNVHAGYWFNRRGWHEWRADLGKVS